MRLGTAMGPAPEQMRLGTAVGAAPGQMRLGTAVAPSYAHMRLGTAIAPGTARLGTASSGDSGARPMTSNKASISRHSSALCWAMDSATSVHYCKLTSLLTVPVLIMI